MPDLVGALVSSLNLQTVLVGLIVVLIVYNISQRIKYKQPPGPFALPLIGNYEVLQAKFSHEKFSEYAKKYGPVFQVYLGPVKVVVLNNIKVVTEALITKKADFANRPQSVSTQIITQGGKDIAFANYTPTWKLHRKIAGKALRQYMVGSQLEKVVHESMTKCLNKMAEYKGPFDPQEIVDLMVFTILNSVVFGESGDFDDPHFDRIMKLDKEVTETFGKGMIEDMFPWMLKIRPSAKYHRFMDIVNEIFDILGVKFKKHQETFDPDNIRDFTDTLILARKEAEAEENTELLSHLTDTHLIQTISDIFFAGIDTSRLTLYFALRYMGGYQDIQSKVQAELDSVVGRNRFPGIKDRENLGYGEATLHEIMRLGTVAPTGVPHSTICDTQVGGYDIPKDTMVMINHWALHYDSNYWKDVDKFDPTRYLDDNGKLSSKPESWLPFSMGRRVCLGESVAKPELHLIFSSILQRFKISLAEGTNPVIEIAGSDAAIQPANFKITVTERK